MTEFDLVMLALALWCVVAAVPLLCALRHYWRETESLADVQRWLKGEDQL